MRIKRNGENYKIEKVLKLTKRQKHRLSLMSSEPRRKKYLLSIAGLHRETVYFSKPCSELPKEHQGRVLKMLQALRETKDVSHRPFIKRNEFRFVGIEIECLIPWITSSEEGSTCYNCDGAGRITVSDSNDYCYDVDCAPCDGSGWLYDEDADESNSLTDFLSERFRSEGLTRVSVKHDGSLSSNDRDLRGVEIAVLCDFENQGLKTLEKVCNILDSLNATVNTTCGLHVHIDAAQAETDDDVLEIGRKYLNFLPILKTLVPKSRLNNTYCKLGASVDDRYYAINLSAYHKFKTVEIRLHSGTTNFVKIKNWVELLVAILKSNNTSVVRSINTMSRVLKLNDEQKKYWLERRAKFWDCEDSGDEDDE